MRLKSLLFKYIAGLFLAVISAQTWAGPVDLVEVSGFVGFSCGSGSGGFEKNCSGGDDIETGPFRLVYDPLVTDSDPNPDAGFFEGAIKSFSMTVSQEHRPDLVFSLVGLGDIYRTTTPLTDGRLVWQMMLSEENNALPPSSFVFGWMDLLQRDPNEMPGTDFWFTAIPYGAGTVGVDETDWLYDPGRLGVRTIPRPLPAPPSVWLLLIGAGAAFLQRRPLRKDGVCSSLPQPGLVERPTAT